MTSALLLWIFACHEPGSEATEYLAAARATDPAVVRDHCLATGDAASECMALSAPRLARQDLDGAMELCGHIEDDVWLDECFFLTAEGQVTEDATVAARACASAGRFSGNCLMHVWKFHATALVGTNEPLGSVAERYAPALTWAEPHLQVDDQLTARFWSVLLDVWTHRDGEHPSVDVADCAALSPEVAPFCRRGLPVVLTRALNRSDHLGRLDAAALCEDGPLPDRIEAAAGIHYTSHPTLDRIARDFATRICSRRPDEHRRLRTP